MSENEFYDNQQKTILTSRWSANKFKIKRILIKLALLILLGGGVGYLGKKVDLPSILSNNNIKIHADNSSKKITTKSMVSSTNQSGGITAQTVKIDPALVVAPTSKGDTQTCTNSNCVQVNNAKMQINQYGPAKLLMTDDQELAITQAMKLYAGLKFKIIRYQQTIDSSNYADKLKNALLNAGMIRVEEDSEVLFSTQLISPGISMITGNNKVYVMNALRNALEENGLTKELVSTDTVDTSSDTLQITIAPNR